MSKKATKNDEKTQQNVKINPPKIVKTPRQRLKKRRQNDEKKKSNKRENVRKKATKNTENKTTKKLKKTTLKCQQNKRQRCKHWGHLQQPCVDYCLDEWMSSLVSKMWVSGSQKAQR